MSYKLNSRCKDITGQRFGRLVANQPIGINPKKRVVDWSCTCDCGKTHIVSVNALCSGNTQSCGCLWQERIVAGAVEALTTHGKHGTPVYNIWKGMNQRCSITSESNSMNYSSRGITICERWKSFENFYSDMGDRPSPDHSIDRIENDAGYSPENCRWATRTEQQRNKRTNRTAMVNGKTLCLAEWEEITGINQRAIKDRLNRGWSDEDAVCKPLQH